MAFQERHILMFLDNFSGHECGVAECEHLLTNVKIEWLPPNCTSLLQPVDQGNGNAFKVRYRKYLHEHMAKMILLDKHPLERVDILRACFCIGDAFNSLDCTTTVTRCFQKAGFVFDISSLMEPSEEDEMLINPGNPIMQSVLSEERSLADPPQISDPEVFIEEVVGNQFNCSQFNVRDEDDEETDITVEGFADSMEPRLEYTSIISSKVALCHLVELEAYFRSKNNEKEAQIMVSLADVESNLLIQNSKQMDIRQMFNQEK